MAVRDDTVLENLYEDLGEWADLLTDEQQKRLGGLSDKLTEANLNAWAATLSINIRNVLDTARDVFLEAGGTLEEFLEAVRETAKTLS